MNMIEVILLVLKASIMLAVFAIGLQATFADATFLFRRPGQLLRAFLSMNVLMPLVALAIAAPFDLHPAVKIALVVISVSPTPPIFPKKAHKAGGKDVTQSVCWWRRRFFRSSSFNNSGDIRKDHRRTSRHAGELCRLTGSDHDFAAAARWNGRPQNRTLNRGSSSETHRGACFCALLLSALPVLIGIAPTLFSFIGDGRVLSLAVFALAGLIIGHLLGGPEENRPVLALATACRHPAVALAIAHANFPNQKLTAAAVFLYVIISAILSALYLAWDKRQRAGHSTAATNNPVKA
jgi:BASS family bile acid:Na+ symporter